MKIQRQRHESKRQKFYRQVMVSLLVLQTLLVGVQAKNRIQQGDSAIEVMIWLINQYIPVLQRVKSLEDEQRKGDK
ncbi:hypothetical protein NIES21_24430 [Anabaenopsis circularis NIES-21]|uniref:Uncharacterized protein n=1 Tax=Anabaenopsis circularis NIES-21 TaxID=1085406 RepID=A0A1Z4GGG1_9CYAN|nr:hypothetical protein NIES21_24430 [Anabaenopsis circularis NIES-21]